MSVILSSQFALRVRDSIREQPLKEKEIRRIEGLGELYVTLPETVLDKKIYTEMYRLRIDGVPIVLYSRHLDWSEAD